MSVMTTSPPSRRTTWPISTPTGPPPRITRRRGTAFMEVASRLPQMPSRSRRAGDGRDDGIGAVGEDDVIGRMAHAVDLHDTRSGQPAGAA